MQSSDKKIKVLILGKDNVGWAIDTERHNIIKLLEGSTDFEITGNILRADIVYSVLYDALSIPYFFYTLHILKKIKGIKIFALVTNNIENTPEKMGRLKGLINTWVSPSSRIHEFLERSGVHAIHVPFLVEKNVFFRTNHSREQLAEILKIDISMLRDKILIGSFQRDSLGEDLSQPKWQKNPKLLVDILKNISKEKILLVLAGPRRHYLVNECRKFGIPYLFVGNEQLIDSGKDDLLENNLSHETMNLLYNLIDVYLVTSKSEGGPLAVLECALTKTLIFSTNVGLANDILSEAFLYEENNFQSVIEGIHTLIVQPNTFAKDIDLNFNRVSAALDEETILQKIKTAFYAH